MKTRQKSTLLPILKVGGSFVVVLALLLLIVFGLYKLVGNKTTECDLANLTDKHIETIMEVCNQEIMDNKVYRAEKQLAIDTFTKMKKDEQTELTIRNTEIRTVVENKYNEIQNKGLTWGLD